MAVLLCLVLFCVSVFPSQSTVSDGIPNPFEDSIPYIMEWPGSYDKVLQEEVCMCIVMYYILFGLLLWTVMNCPFSFIDGIKCHRHDQLSVAC